MSGRLYKQSRVTLEGLRDSKTFDLNFRLLAIPPPPGKSINLNIMTHAASATYTASTSLAELRKQLGEPVASSLRYAPLDKLITKSQNHEPDAISFMLLFGHLRQQRTDNKQEVWILLCPPKHEGGQMKMLFHSYDHATEDVEWHDGQNISSTAECAAAFKMPKKASRSKHVALAKYYFLQKLAAAESENSGICELKFPLVANKGLLEGLKSACCEFEDEAKSTTARSDKQSHTSSATVANSQSSDTTITADASQERVCANVQSTQEVQIQAASRAPEDTSRGARARTSLHHDAVQVIADLYEKEMQLRADAADLDDQLLALTEERLELEQKRRKLEEQRLKNEEERKNTTAQRVDLFKGLSSEDAFELGRNIERSHSAKRRKID